MTTIKTKYRIFNDGYNNYLQYESKTFLSKEWKYIPSFLSISETILSEQHCYISDCNCDDFDKFVEKYPSITDYLCEYEIKKKIFEQRLIESRNKPSKVIKEY